MSDRPGSPEISNSGVLAWAIVSDRPGDRAQAEAVVSACGWPYEVKAIVPRGGSRHQSPPRAHDAGRLDPAQSSTLQEPWPDIVVAIGRWSVRAAAWVARRSGGRTKIVLLGRPRSGEIDEFDLIVCPSQYSIPRHRKIVRLDFPLLRADPARVERASREWAQRLSALPRPLTAVLVGGETKPFRLDAAVGRTLAHDLRELRRQDDGSLYVATSPRSGAALGAALREELAQDAVFDWARDRREDNPYQALLGFADRFIVTGDSISMLVEVASLRRPLAIYALPKRTSPLVNAIQSLRTTMSGRKAGGWRRSLALTLHRHRLVEFPRDLEALHAKLIERGHAVPFGRTFPAGPPALPDELPAVVARLRALQRQPTAVPFAARGSNDLGAGAPQGLPHR